MHNKTQTLNVYCYLGFTSCRDFHLFFVVGGTGWLVVLGLTAL